ncbi:Hsp20/alpha crystallin family protein [Spirochaetota bacterium]
MTEEVKTNHDQNNECVLVPLTDVYENSEKYSLVFEMPGVEKENLDITIDNDVLEINGKTSPFETEGKELKYSEYNLHNYQRKFKIGNEINHNKVEANLTDGVLTLDLFKSEEVKPKKIDINVVN